MAVSSLNFNLIKRLEISRFIAGFKFTRRSRKIKYV